MTLLYPAMKAAVAAIRDHADDMSDLDLLMKIADAMEDSADELAADQPHATVTIAAWRTAGRVLADIAFDLPEEI